MHGEIKKHESILHIFIKTENLIVSWQAQQQPEKKVISPDFLFTIAWDYQGRLTRLQDDINYSIQLVQAAVSVVLKNSTTKTLHQFEDHVDIVVNEYTPYLLRFNELKPSDCRSSAENIFNEAVRFTGFDAGVCAYKYNDKVQTKVDEASKSLTAFDDVYSQVQTIVVKAFIGQNTFVTPEEIKQRIINVFELIESRWNLSKPEVEALVQNLADAVAVQNAELGKCHDKIMSDAVSQFSWFGRMVQSCIDFNNSQDSVGRLGRTAATYEQLFQEYKAEFAKLKHYEWSA